MNILFSHLISGLWENEFIATYLPLFMSFFSNGLPLTFSKRLNSNSVSGADVTTLFGGLGFSCLSSEGLTGLSINSLSGLWSSGKSGGRQEYVFWAMELDLIELGWSQNDCGSDRCFIGNGSGWLEKILWSYNEIFKHVWNAVKLEVLYLLAILVTNGHCSMQQRWIGIYKIKQNFQQEKLRNTLLHHWYAKSKKRKTTEIFHFY